MTVVVEVPWSDLQHLFSIVMCVDESMRITYASDTLEAGMPEISGQPLFSDIFNVVRPGALNRYEDLCAVRGSLCLLTAKNEQFAVRGQFLNVTYDGTTTLCLCGSPWLHWINTNAPQTRLTLSDFSAQDVQLDQLFFMSTERKIIDDLETLNKELQLAKQQLEETQQSQKQFFAQMSHEIRTPLNGVVSALTLLEQGALNGEQSKYIHLAQTSSRNLMQVINYVLNVSKIEISSSGEQAVFSWEQLISTTIEIVSAKAHEKSLGIELDIASNLPPACIGSPTRLRQTLLNLLINAIKFTNYGAITVRAFPIDEADKPQKVRLEVIDSGVGIAAEDMKYVFEPFWSSSPEGLQEREEGTGLGLDIVRRSVASMGGNIEVVSQPGLGTKFWFELPVTLAPVDHLEKKVPESTDALGELAGKVLLVDDNETNLMLGALILESIGLDVVTATSGDMAIAEVKGQSFDLVLMDISMPEMDGLEATRRIRSFRDSEQLKIVALTAYVDYAEKAACLNVGMQDYLTKPINKDELHRALARWLLSTEKTSIESGANPTSQAEKEPTESIIDQAVLLEMSSQIGLDNLKRVVDKVQNESAERWSQLEIANDQSDEKAITLHVHSLASIFSSVGLSAIAAIMGSVERGLRSGVAPSSNWLEDLVLLRNESFAALDREMAQL